MALAGEEMLQFFQELSANSPAVIARIMAAYEHPVPAIAHTLPILPEAGRLHARDVALLGADTQALARIAYAFTERGNAAAFEYNLSVGVAMDVYERQIDAILHAHGAVG